jgi:hexosaminidase
MLKKLSVLLLLLNVILWPAKAQTAFNPANLHLKWQILQNTYQGKSQFLSALTLINQDKNSMPANGWKLYFNFVRLVVPASVTGAVQIEHLNGDLFCLSPKTDFKVLKPKDSLRIEFVAADWAVNFTDAPDGFYFINNNAPAQPVAVKNVTPIPAARAEQYLRKPGDQVTLTTPDAVFNQNKLVQDIAAEKLPPIFPTPNNYHLTTGNFRLNAAVNITADAIFSNEKSLLKQELAQVFLLPTKQKTATNTIYLRVKEALPPEGYQLKITTNTITISASTRTGVFYALQSLKTMFPGEAWKGKLPDIQLPGIEVNDAPRFAYRGLLLDVARNFQTKKQVLKVLDLMALYKLNVLHFHLTDDEGWRLEIPSLPELTEVGSKRGHTLNNIQHLQPSYGSGPDVNNPTGTGFYSKADFIEILKYANTHHITVIPEIETPGHARAAVKAMDARYQKLLLAGKKTAAKQYLLHDLKDSSVYQSVQYWNDNVIDVSLPSTYRFMETVADELISFYRAAGAPLKTIHFGGDEVPAGVWQKSPSCLKLMAANPTVKNTDDLWYYYYDHINQILKKRNLYASGWEEAALRKTVVNGVKANVPNPDFAHQNFHTYVWNNVLGWGAEDLAYKLANAGYPVVLSNVTNLYFDIAYQKAFEEPGYYWGGYLDVDKPFKFIPYNYFKNTTENGMGNPIHPKYFATKEALTAQGKANIVGIQGLLWGETVKGPKEMEYRLLPKMLGLAERAWSKDPDWATETDSVKSKVLYQQAWSVFTNVLSKKELPRLNYYASGFAYRIPTAGVLVENGAAAANVQLPGMTIRYTTNGQEPSVSSPVYTKPVATKGTLKFRVFNAADRGGRSVTVLNP